MTCRTGVGLDVHARPAASAALGRLAGEVTRRSFAYDSAAVAAWALSLEGPARRLCESGPTDFGSQGPSSAWASSASSAPLARCPGPPGTGPGPTGATQRSWPGCSPSGTSSRWRCRRRRRGRLAPGARDGPAAPLPLMLFRGVFQGSTRCRDTLPLPC